MGRASRYFMEFVSGLLAGLTLGYVAALLLAPSEGVQSRERLQEGAESLRGGSRQVVDQVQDRLQRAVEQGREAAAEARAELERSARLEPEVPTSDTEGNTVSI